MSDPEYRGKQGEVSWAAKKARAAHASHANKTRVITEEVRERLRNQAKLMQANRWFKTAEEAEQARPELTPERAHQYVMLLRAGKPPYHALKTFDAGYYHKLPTAMRMSWWRAWDRHPLVEEARLHLAGVNWELLTQAQREAIALDKHFSELAWYLMANQFFSADGLKLVKMREARRALVERANVHPDTTGPFAQLLKKLLHRVDKEAHELGAPAFYEPPPKELPPQEADFVEDDEPEPPETEH